VTSKGRGGLAGRQAGRQAPCQEPSSAPCAPAGQRPPAPAPATSHPQASSSTESSLRWSSPGLKGAGITPLSRLPGRPATAAGARTHARTHACTHASMHARTHARVQACTARPHRTHDEALAAVHDVVHTLQRHRLLSSCLSRPCVCTPCHPSNSIQFNVVHQSCIRCRPCSAAPSPPSRCHSRPCGRWGAMLHTVWTKGGLQHGGRYGVALVLPTHPHRARAVRLVALHRSVGPEQARR